MRKINFKKIITIGVVFFSLCSFLAVGVSSLMICGFTLNYGELLKKTEKNVVLIEKMVLDTYTPSESREFLLDMINLYTLSKECMEYYKIEDIDVYMKLQSKMYRLRDLKENYIRYQAMERNNKKLSYIVNL